MAGLESAKRIVRRIASGETGVHAVLLYGAKGSGKSALADALAEAWLCRNPGPDGACGTCQACAAFGRGTSADVLRIEPVGASRIIRLGAFTEVTPPDADYRVPLRHFLRTSPLSSRNKVALIVEADRMNDRAYNALLKTLEEPQAQGKIILLTESVGRLAATILSRCLAIACALPTTEEVRQMVSEVTDDDLRLAEGAPGRVAAILENPGPYRAIADFARGLKTRPAGSALKASEEFRALADALEKISGAGARTANAEALDLLAAFLAREEGTNPRWTQHVVEAHRRILGNGNAGLIFDALFVRLLR